MPLVPCQCTNCGGTLEIDNTLEAAVCKFCGTPFIVEKAINVYKTVNVTTNTTDWKRLAENGMQMIRRDFFDHDALEEICNVLKEVSEEEFYVRYFEYVLDIDYSTKNIAWLGKNIPSERVDEVVDYLYREILSDFSNKENILDIKFNIHKNFTKVVPDFIMNDKALRSLLFLTYMGNKLTGQGLEYYEYLKNEAIEEISNYKYENRDEVYAIGIFVWAFRDFIGPDYADSVKDTINSHCVNLPLNNYRDDFGPINQLKNMGYTVNYSFKVSNDCIVHENSFDILGRTYPLENLLAITDYDGNAYLIIKTEDSKATIVKLPGVNNTNFMFCFPACDHLTFNNIETLSKYNGSYKEYKMEYIEGFSYKETILGSVFKFLGKLIK